MSAVGIFPVGVFSILIYLYSSPRDPGRVFHTSRSRKISVFDQARHCLDHVSSSSLTFSVSLVSSDVSPRCAQPRIPLHVIAIHSPPCPVRPDLSRFHSERVTPAAHNYALLSTADTTFHRRYDFHICCSRHRATLMQNTLRALSDDLVHIRLQATSYFPEGTSARLLPSLHAFSSPSRLTPLSLLTVRAVNRRFFLGSHGPI